MEGKWIIVDIIKYNKTTREEFIQLIVDYRSKIRELALNNNITIDNDIDSDNNDPNVEFIKSLNDLDIEVDSILLNKHGIKIL